MPTASKGIIFSIDAMLALVAATSLIVASFFFLSQIQILQWTQPQLYIVSLDSLATLREGNILHNAVQQRNMTKIQDFLDHMTEQHVCSHLEIYNWTGREYMYSINKTGCPALGNEFYTSRRTFIVGRVFYYAAMKSWFE